MILPIQRCEGNWTRNILYYASDVLVDIRNTTVMLRCGNDIVPSKDWVRRSQEIPRNNSKISQKVRNNQAQPGLCWQKVKMSSMISQIVEGQGWYFSHEFNWHLWRSQSVDGDHDRFCRETLWRCHRAEKEGWSERLWEPRIRHKLEGKRVVRGEMIRWGRST